MDKRKLLNIIIIVSILFLISSCYRPGSLDATGYFEAYAVLKYSCPLFSGGTNAFDDVKIVEKDNYGRILYAYIYNSYASFLVICQKVERISRYNMTVYWYDECWIVKDPIHKNNRAYYAEYSEEEINLLKDENDWGKPLDETRLLKGKFEESETDKKTKAENKNKLDKLCVETYGLAAGKLGCIRNIIYKNNYAYTLAETEKGTFFICYDCNSNIIVRDKAYDGEIIDCRNVFCNFIKNED